MRRTGGMDGGWLTALVALLAFGYWRLLWALARVLWRCCRFVWEGRQPFPDPLAWVFRLRDVAGIVLVGSAILIWHPADQVWAAANSAINDGYSGRVEAAFIVIVAVILVAATFAVIAAPGSRLKSWSLAAIPVVTVIVTMAIVALLIWAAAAVPPLVRMPLPAGAPDGSQILLGLGLAVLLLVFGSAAMAVFGALLWFPTRSFFRAGDAHPLQRPVLAMILAAYVLVRGVLTGLAAPDPVLPEWAAWALTMGGPVSILMLSAWQIIRLRAVGWRFRRLPYAVETSRISSVAFVALHGIGRAIIRMRAWGRGVRRSGVSVSARG